MAMGKFSHLSERRDHDDGDDNYEPLPREGLGNINPRLYRMSKVAYRITSSERKKCLTE